MTETTRPAYFVVSKNDLGKEVPMIYWDEMPRKPIRGLVYVLRLDTYPNGSEMSAAPLSQLYTTYCWLRDHGKLPPRWTPPKTSSDVPLGGSRIID